MHENIFWDKKITDAAAKNILSGESHPRFIEFSSLLLARTNDIKMVFNMYLDKITFCRNWRKIKRAMRKNKWNDPRIDFWDEVYQVTREDIDVKKLSTSDKDDRVVPQQLKAIGVVIRKARKRKGWTQKDLSGNARISQQMISYIERGYPNFSIETLNKIADTLELKISIKQKISYIPPNQGSVTNTSGDLADLQ